MIEDGREAAFTCAIARAEAHAPFLRNLLGRWPADVARLRCGAVSELLQEARTTTPEPVGRALRQERQRLALALAIGDLAGHLTLEQVTSALSDFADRALDRAIAAAIAERTPGAEVAGLVALALGKHGSGELNYSSDIDPIFLFDPSTLPRRAREEPEEAAVRITRRVLELLQHRDGEGYVFRVDLRLRPSPEATGIAVPVDAALSYYESLALPWERAAFIRARPAAGDLDLGERFLASLSSFVWRRSLDFGAIAEIHDVSRRIRAHYAGGQVVGPGYDLKRGRGGIREIEFFAQIHQLIHGGRDATLRAPATLDAIGALDAAGLIDRPTATLLAGAYRRHRTIEHRLQMIEDKQTHSLPIDLDALDNVGQLHGLPDGKALIAVVRADAEPVGVVFDGLAPASAPALPSDGEALRALGADLAFADPERFARAVAGWRSGSIPAVRSPAARAALETMLPRFLEALSRASDSMAALNRFDDLVRRLPSAINLFRLIEARPLLGDMLADLMSLAPTLADALGRRPTLLDGLIDASAFEPMPSLADLVASLQLGRSEGGLEQLLDSVRSQVAERRFALGAQLVLGLRDPLLVAEDYARLAEAAVEVLTAAIVMTFEAAHGCVPGGELVILALGRFGGGALTHASDLDIIFLFTGDFAAKSDGARPLGATHYFNRLAQRVTAALSVSTASGPLYPIDTRLRPSGNQGLLAVSIDSFARYQMEGAWTWEHMALARARPVFGSPTARKAVARVVSGTLHKERDTRKVIRDAVKMRADIAQHKPPAGSFDVKLVPGGLVDFEFAVHVRQLVSRIGLDPRLAVAAAALVEAGQLKQGAVDAFGLLARMLVTLRLIAPDSGEPGPAARGLLARVCGADDWEKLLARYAAARETVSNAWGEIVTRAEGD